MEENNETNVEETKVEEKQIDESKFKSAGDDSVVKVDLSKPKTEDNAVQERKTEEVPVEESPGDSGGLGEQVTSANVVEEITEENKEVQNEQPVPQEQVIEEPTTVLPENLKKLADFMNETGGTLNDYVELNKNYEEEDDSEILRDYYEKTKPHLNAEEINFMLEDRFSYDEEVDDEKEVRRKKLELKEQVADAKNHLDNLKSKYYEDIKTKSTGLDAEQQKAIDFFNRYNKESEESEKTFKMQQSKFQEKTEGVFNDEFKGFEYNVGEKKFRFNVNNADNVKQNQLDINNFVKKFLNKDNLMEDANGYHKALYTANNPDAIAQHFYEQGKADALKETVDKAKNVNTSARKSHGEIEVGGLKFKVVGDQNSSGLKFRNKK
tara:strand:+ start:3509 stop:4648 length:1140 start_codon:yes stop_codon:yes gene_type:complete